MKIAAQITPEPTQEDLDFICQMGVEYVVLWTNGEKATYDYYSSRKGLFESVGLKVYGFGNSSVHNQDVITLGLPGRDEKIEEYKTHLRNLGKAGIPYTTYAHMANGIWSTEREFTRGNASARAFDLEKGGKGWWMEREYYEGPLTHERRYSEDEIWENFIYFIKQVAPVAEEANVRIGIHPDDPPVEELGGIPRCILAILMGTNVLSKSPIAPMSVCVSVSAAGSKVDRRWVRMSSKRSVILANTKNFSRCISAISISRCLILSKPLLT